MFNYFPASIGAYLLHLATSNYLYNNGRVLGWSSILYSSLTQPNVFNLPSVLGMLVSALVTAKYLPQYRPDYDFVSQNAPFGPLLTALLAGLFTGVGTKWGSGCTSGHMLCGIARLSIRSIVATISFCTSAIATSWLFSTPLDCSPECAKIVHPDTWTVKVLLSLVAAAQIGNYALRTLSRKTNVFRIINSFYSGAVFATGLLISGLGNPATTLGFLAIPTPSKFDPTLLMVVVFGIVPNMIEYFTTGPKLNPGATVDTMQLPTRKDIPPKLVVGGVLFGVGWGLTGTCPAPGIMSSVLHPSEGLLWLASFLVAYYFS